MARKPNTALIYQRVPTYLASMRTSAGLNQREFAEKVGKTQSWVARCETGDRRIDIAEWIEWCAALGLDPRAAIDGLLRTKR